MLTYYLPAEAFQEVCNLTSLSKRNVDGVCDSLADFETTSEHIIFLTSNEMSADNVPPEEDKENFRPLLHSSLQKSDDSTLEYDKSGAPLPLDRIADLSAAEKDHTGSFEAVKSEKEPLSVRNVYRLGVGNLLSDGDARRILARVLQKVKKGKGSWMTRNDVTICVPCGSDRPMSNTVCCGLTFNSKIMGFDVKCVKEGQFISQLPPLETLPSKLYVGRDQVTIDTEYQSTYSLHAVKKPNRSDAVSIVKYHVTFRDVKALLEPPSQDAQGTLTVRPEVGWRTSDVHFLYRDIQRLKVLVSVIENEAPEWPSDYDDFNIDDFNRQIFTKFKRLASMAEASINVEESVMDAKTGFSFDSLAAELCENIGGKWKCTVQYRPRDVTEVIWLLLKGVGSRVHLKTCLQTIIKCLNEKNISYKVNKDNFSELASILRRLNTEGTRFLIPPLNRISLLAEVGLYSLLNDHREVLISICKQQYYNLSDLKSLEPFMTGGQMLEEKMELLQRLHVACEYATLMESHVGSHGITENIKHVLSTLSTSNSPARQLTFTFSSRDMKEVLNRHRPTRWSVRHTLSGRRQTIVKNLFRRPVLDVIDTGVSSLPKYYHLLMLWRDVS